MYALLYAYTLKRHDHSLLQKLRVVVKLYEMFWKIAFVPNETSNSIVVTYVLQIKFIALPVEICTDGCSLTNFLLISGPLYFYCSGFEYKT